MAGRKKIKRTKAEELILINFRMSRKDKLSLKRLADRFAGGSVAHWLRYIALNGRPKKGVTIREAA